MAKASWRRWILWAGAAVLVAAPCAVAQTAAWVPRKNSPLDQQVELAIHKGLQALLESQKPDGTWSSASMRAYPGAMESMVLLGAASAGEDLRQPKYKASLEYVLSLSPLTVPARSLRAMLYAQLPVEQYGLRLTADIDWLQQQQDKSGGWGMGPGHPLTMNYPDWIDSTNSLWAVLALGAGGQAGVGVSPAVLEKARVFWLGSQNSDGGWGYQPPGEIRVRGESSGSTTAAGLAALLTISNLLQNADGGSGSGGGAANQAALAKGLKWLVDHSSPVANPNRPWGPTDDCLNYYLFCVQSAVEAGGTRRLTARTLHAEVADTLLSRQSPQGTWRQPIAGNEKDDPFSTALGVLCLAQAGSGLALSKLNLDVEGARHNDAANMVRMLGASVGRAVSYQVLAGTEPDAIVGQAPLLYHPVPASGLSKAAAQRIALYVRGGGVAVLAVPDGKASQTAEALLPLLPNWTGAPLTAGHPIFTMYYKIAAEGLVGLGEGSQTRVFLVPPAFAEVWSGKRVPNCPARPFLANLLMYATDFALPGQSRIVSPARRAAPLQSIPVARLKTRGGDVHPRALPCLSEALAAAIDRGVSESLADPASPIPPAIPLLWLTGTGGAPPLAAAERENLRTFVANGGTLFIDAAGQADFQTFAADLAAALLPKGRLLEVPRNHPLLTGLFAEGIGGNITAVRYTRSVQTASPLPNLLGVELDGRLAVIVSPYAVTATMDGHVPFGCKGYQPDDARRIAANIVLYAASRR